MCVDSSYLVSGWLTPVLSGLMANGCSWYIIIQICLPVSYNITLLYITIIIVLCFVISSVFESASLRF